MLILTKSCVRITHSGCFHVININIICWRAHRNTIYRKLENLQPEASFFVLADVVLQVGFCQHGAPGNLLRQTHKQATCDKAHTHSMRSVNEDLKIFSIHSKH